MTSNLQLEEGTIVFFAPWCGFVKGRHYGHFGIVFAPQTAILVTCGLILALWGPFWWPGDPQVAPKETLWSRRCFVIDFWWFWGTLFGVTLGKFGWCFFSFFLSQGERLGCGALFLMVLVIFVRVWCTICCIPCILYDYFVVFIICLCSICDIRCLFYDFRLFVLRFLGIIHHILFIYLLCFFVSLRFCWGICSITSIYCLCCHYFC